MLREIGYCHGIENYSRHLSGRGPGETPPTLIDYLPKDALVVIDESHVGGAAGPRHVPRRPLAQGGARRVRLPPALGLRQPAAHLRGVHARSPARRSTCRPRPAPYELRAVAGDARRPSRSSGRPASWTPRSRCGPPASRWTTCMEEIRARAERDERVLVTTLTKRMAEDLTEYYQQIGPPRPLPALRHRHPRAGRGHPRPAPGQVRRADRHQPAARGARHPRGVAGRDPGRGQGGLPPLGDLAHPDLGPRRPQRQRRGHHVRGQGHRTRCGRPSRRRSGAA